MLTFTDNKGIEWTQEQLIQAHQTDTCPMCGEHDLGHGTFLSTMTEDLDCPECDWQVEYTSVGAKMPEEESGQ